MNEFSQHCDDRTLIPKKYGKTKTPDSADSKSALPNLVLFQNHTNFQVYIMRSFFSNMFYDYIFMFASKSETLSIIENQTEYCRKTITFFLKTYSLSFLKKYKICINYDFILTYLTCNFV